MLKKDDLLELKTGYRCAYCGCDLNRTPVHTDHILPKSKGGEGKIYNLVLACGSCNSRKGTKTLEEFRSYCSGESLANQARKHIRKINHYKERIPKHIYDRIMNAYDGVIDSFGDFEIVFFFESDENKENLSQYAKECEKSPYHKRYL